MAKPVNSKKKDSTAKPDGITRISVSGFKSIADEQSIEVRPLTILAGANSSGKSSIMQPLLLLKQTLEASYDPGALRLDGPNVKFTSADQFLSRVAHNKYTDVFTISIEVGDKASLPTYFSLTTYFRKQPDKPIEVQRSIFIRGGDKKEFHAGMSSAEIKSVVNSGWIKFPFIEDSDVLVTPERFFLGYSFVQHREGDNRSEMGYISGFELEPYIRQTIHVTGLRGNLERTYIVAAVGKMFPGTFENYAASIIAKWQADNDGNLEGLSQDLSELGLTSRISARTLNETQIELQVARLPQVTKGKMNDMVNVVDVGSGVSHTLPVVVALREAKPGQLVYVEQPELHLHPRAQTAMAKVLADAAARGVHVVAETHSALLILGIQTLVAEGKLAPELVKLHWFERKDGVTKIRSADLDETGSFGDWPEDFADVELEAQSRYLDAVEARTARTKRRRAG
jgi:predicted ATPase